MVDCIHKMEPYGGLFFAGTALAGAGVIILRNSYRDYANKRKMYKSVVTRMTEDTDFNNEINVIDKPTYLGSLRKELSEWKKILSAEESRIYP